jgi:hypothetical protein
MKYDLKNRFILIEQSLCTHGYSAIENNPVDNKNRI